MFLGGLCERDGISLTEGTENHGEGGVKRFLDPFNAKGARDARGTQAPGHGDEGASCKTQQNTVGMEPGPPEYCLFENVVNHIGGGVIRLAGLAEASDVFEVIA